MIRLLSIVGYPYQYFLIFPCDFDIPLILWTLWGTHQGCDRWRFLQTTSKPQARQSHAISWYLTPRIGSSARPNTPQSQSCTIWGSTPPTKPPPKEAKYPRENGSSQAHCPDIVTYMDIALRRNPHHKQKHVAPFAAPRRFHPPPRRPFTHIWRLHPLRQRPLRQTPPLRCINNQQQPPLRQIRPRPPNGRRTHLRRTSILHAKVPRTAQHMEFGHGAVASGMAVQWVFILRVQAHIVIFSLFNHSA